MSDNTSAPAARRILVIEDNDELRALVARALTGRGHQVTVAEDGDKGLAALRGGTFDLLITDLIMPGSEGIEVILSAKSEAPRMKIIAMSGGSLQGGHDYLPLAGKLGASAVLHKPFGLQDLMGTVDGLLGLTTAD